MLDLWEKNYEAGETISKILLSLTILIMAGCITQTPPPSTPAPTQADVPIPEIIVEQIRVFRLPFNLSLSAEAAGAKVGDHTDQTFNVDANATHVFAEARWTCSVPLCDLTLDLNDPNNMRQGEVLGTNNASIRLEGPMEGSWHGILYASNVLVNASGELRVSVFYNAEISPSYSAFGQR